jgi:ComF family protein
VFANALSNLGREALRIVLPSWCIACRSALPLLDNGAGRSGPVCASCWSSLPKINVPKCRSCAMPCTILTLGETDGDLCFGCLPDPLPVDWCDAWGRYSGPLERVLHALKFERHDFLDDQLAALLEETLRDRDFDAIVPVPMHWLRARRRGYNQAELLARALAKRIGIPAELRLRKKHGGAPQSTLARDARARNVRGAFAASPRVKGKRILIVDDICTTGETLRACARALLREEASRVCAIAIAKAT